MSKSYYWLFCQFCDVTGEVRNLKSESYDMNKEDTNFESDEFVWLHEKGVDLHTVDVEAEMEKLGEFQRWLIPAWKKGELGRLTNYDIKAAKHWAKEEWVNDGKELDKRLAMVDTSDNQEVFNDYSDSSGKVEPWR